MYSYHVHKSGSDSSDIRYGIELRQDDSVISVIEDISVSKSDIETLVNVFNREALDPVHLEQAVEDYLTDFVV